MSIDRKKLDMLEFSNKDALFIDIDETLVQPRKNVPTGPQQTVCGFAFLYIMQQAAVKQKGMSSEEAEKIIAHVLETTSWWHWSDFILALDLEAHTFWDYAFEEEREHLEPVSPDLPYIFSTLYNNGYRMFITSNNPDSGILHKLRIAGLGNIWGSPYFLQYLGPPGVRQMKWDTQFWKEIIARTGLDPRYIVTIGDNFPDDITVPAKSGINRRIYLNWDHSGSVEVKDGVWKVGSWNQILTLLVKEERPQIN